MPSAPPPLLPDGLPPEQSSWQTAAQIARKYGIERSTVVAHLNKVNVAPFYVSDHRLPLPVKLAFYDPETCAIVEKDLQRWLRVPPLGRYVPLSQAAEEVGATTEWVLSTIRSQGLPEPVRRRNRQNKVTRALPPSTLKKLRTVRPDYPPAGWNTCEQLSRMTGKAYLTVQRQLGKAGIKPLVFMSPLDGRSHPYYPPETVKVLGVRDTAIPAAGDWLTRSEISQRINRSNEWTGRRLRSPRFKRAAQERIASSGVVYLHYPPWVAAELEETSEAERVPKATAGWYNATQMAALLGRSKNWVKARVSQPQHAKEGRLRLNKASRKHIHYPTRTYLALKAESEREKGRQEHAS